MAGSVVDAFFKTVTGVVRVGKDVGGRAVETAGPRIVSSVEAVRSRFTGPHPKPATASDPGGAAARAEAVSCRPDPGERREEHRQARPGHRAGDPGAEAGAALRAGSQAPGTQAGLSPSAT